MTIPSGSYVRAVVNLKQPSNTNAMLVTSSRYFHTGATNLDIVNDYADRVNAFWAMWRPYVATVVQLVDLVVQVVQWLPNDKGKLIWKVVTEVGRRSINSNGTYNADLVDQRIAQLVRQAVASPKTEGKKYLPGTTELAHSAGVSTSAAAITAANSCLNITLPVGFGSPVTRTIVWGVLTNKGTFKEFSGTVQSSTVTATQKRRKIGVGW
jgi:hypothetical protein